MAGILSLGYKPVFFEEEKELEGWRPDYLVVGGMSLTNRIKVSYGIPIP